MNKNEYSNPNHEEILDKLHFISIKVSIQDQNLKQKLYLFRTSNFVESNFD